MRTSPSRTAQVVCYFRASEQLTPPTRRIVDDPFAETFLTPSFRTALRVSRFAGGAARALSLGLRGFVLARHRFIDDALLRATEETRFERLLVLGSGYDTRAWRLADVLCGMPVYEVDHPATQDRKIRVARSRLPPAPTLRPVPVNFEREDLRTRLHEEGFADGGRTHVIWEGVSMYLTREAVTGTLGDLARLCAPGSRLSMDFLSFPDQHDWLSTFHRVSPQLLSLLGEPVSFVLHPQDVPAFVERLGWQVIDRATSGELADRYVGATEPVYGPMFTVTLERLPSASP